MHFFELCGRRGSRFPPKDPPEQHQMSVFTPCASIPRIQFNRTFEVRFCLRVSLFCPPAIHHGPKKYIVVRLQLTVGHCGGGLTISELYCSVHMAPQRCGDPICDFLLNRKQILCRTTVPFPPHRFSTLRIYQFSSNKKLISGSAYCAFKHIPHSQFAPNCRYIYGLSFELLSSIASEHMNIAKAGQVCYQVLS